MFLDIKTIITIITITIIKKIQIIFTNYV